MEMVDYDEWYKKNILHLEEKQFQSIMETEKFKYKVELMKIRNEIISTREKMANLYLRTENDELLPVMGYLYSALKTLKEL